MKTDPDAIEIGALFQKAREAAGEVPKHAPEVLPPEPKREPVTPIRHFSGKMSGSRNASSGPDGHAPSADATSCHWCREKFQHGQKRFAILESTNALWGLVSVCVECWKCAYDSAKKFEREHGRSASDSSAICCERVARDCAGCGEPISIPIPDKGYRFRGTFRWFNHCVCSMRCYQRVYRKRKRETGSSIDWKGVRRARCITCKKSIPNGKRADAHYCSDACRQWHYRKRKLTAHNPAKPPTELHGRSNKRAKARHSAGYSMPKAPADTHGSNAGPGGPDDLARSRG
jgi:hypothetical protein